MTYSTHIPKTTYAQRHRSFLTIREDARRSLGNCGVMQDIMVRRCSGKLDRNYIDADMLGRAVQQIVKLSSVMRELAPVANQPDPPRYEPVSVETRASEARTYGGIKASRLVRVLNFIRGLKRSQGNGVAAKRMMRISDRLINGLDIYNRVKALVTKLSDAVDAPDTAMTPRPHRHTPSTRANFKWEVSPQKIYGWTGQYAVKGYDPRQTSVYWLEKQALGLKRAVYRDYHGIEVTRSNGQKPTDDAPTEYRTYVPPKGADITHQIWPPIDLVRMIEERQTGTHHPTNTPTCHSGAAQRNPEPRENLVHLDDGLRENVAEPRKGLRKSQRLCGMTDSNMLVGQTPTTRADPESPLPET